jgi:opacity protein-like surface antigen
MRMASTAAAASIFVALAAASFSNEVAAQETKLLPQLAYSYGENETPRSLAMGGALRALGNGTAAVFVNPANMPLTRLYHIEGNGQFTPEVTRAVGTLVAVDSITSSTRIAGGASFTGGLIDPDGLNRVYTDARTVVAYPFGDRFFLGAGLRYVRMIQDGYGILDNATMKTYSSVSGGLLDESGKRKPFVDTFTFDAGATFRIGESFHIGVVGQNLTHPDNSLLPTTVGGGIGYGTNDFSIEVDGLADFDSWQTVTARVMAGFEYLFSNKYPVRLGYRWDQGADVHALSAGVGYVSTDFGIELGVRRTLSTTINSTMLAVGLTYHLESSALLSGRTNNEL